MLNINYCKVCIILNSYLSNDLQGNFQYIILNVIFLVSGKKDSVKLKVHYKYGKLDHNLGNLNCYLRTCDEDMFQGINYYIILNYQRMISNDLMNLYKLSN